MKLMPQVMYEDKDYKLIRNLKDKLGNNWHDFILELVEYYIGKEKDNEENEGVEE